jgi:hypothetical protein
MKLIKVKDIEFEIMAISRIAELGTDSYEDKMKSLEYANQLTKKEFVYNKLKRE